MIFNFCIYNRKGQALYYREWHRADSSGNIVASGAGGSAASAPSSSAASGGRGGGGAGGGAGGSSRGGRSAQSMQASAQTRMPSEEELAEERRLVFGVLFSIKDLAQKMSPRPSVDGLHTLTTNTFRLHHLETVTGLRFVINTDNQTPDLQQHLLYIYSHLFVQTVARNPLYRYKKDEPITSTLFEQRLDEYLMDLVK